MHDVARLGHTGARGLATRGCAPPVQVCNQIIGTGSIIVECKSGTTLIIHEFAVTYNAPWYSLRTNMGGCKIQNFWSSPQTPLNASALCTEVRTNVHSVPMLCPTIDVVLATPLKPTPEIECIYNTCFSSWSKL